MRNLKSFKIFESDRPYITKADIELIFIELIDDGYEFRFYTDENDVSGTYYFDLRKKFNRKFDFNTDVYKYGCRDLDSMQEEIKKVFEVLKVIKGVLNEMKYEIGFEPEFTFSEDTLFSIVCHLAHSNIKDEDNDY
jgi:hypothetical protein